MTEHKIVIYYRDLPSQLTELVAGDHKIKLIKDGVKNVLGVKCPRCTIVVESDIPVRDEARIKKIVTCLEELEENNQIASFSITKQ